MMKNVPLALLFGVGMLGVETAVQAAAIFAGSQYKADMGKLPLPADEHAFGQHHAASFDAATAVFRERAMITSEIRPLSYPRISLMTSGDSSSPPM